MSTVLMVLSAISAVVTLTLIGTGHPVWAMAGVVVTLSLGAFESLIRTGNPKGGSHERTK